MKTLSTILLSLLVVGLLGAGGYYYWQYRGIKPNSSATVQDDVGKLVAKVSKIMELPQGETPTVATVSAKDQLQDQDFFKNAANGDKILIYAGYKMAVLYRPSTNKIIKVAPLVLGQDETSQTTSTNTNKPSSQNSANTNKAAP